MEYCPYLQAANRGWQAACLGQFGESTNLALPRLQSLLAACPPPFSVVIEEGVNDVFWHNFDIETGTTVCGGMPVFAPDQIVLRLQEMTDAIHAVDPGIATFVATTLHGCGFSSGCEFDDLCAVSNGVVQTFGAAALDFQLEVSEFASDLVHTNEAGRVDLAARVTAAIALVMPSTTTTLP